jgi:hypothetical protein
MTGTYMSAGSSRNDVPPARGRTAPEVTFVERGDVRRGEALGEGDPRGVGEPEPGLGIAFGDLHRGHDRPRPPLDEIGARRKVGA